MAGFIVSPANISAGLDSWRSGRGLRCPRSPAAGSCGCCGELGEAVEDEPDERAPRTREREGRRARDERLGMGPTCQREGREERAREDDRWDPRVGAVVEWAARGNCLSGPK